MPFLGVLGPTRDIFLNWNQGKQRIIIHIISVDSEDNTQY